MLSDIYLVCGGIGFIYIIGTSLLGALNSSDSGGMDGGGDAGGGDAGGDFGGSDAGGDFAGGDAGGDFGGGNAGGDFGGGDAGGDFGGGDAGGDFGGGDAGGDFGGDGGAVDTRIAHTGAQFRAGMMAKTRGRQLNWTLLFLKIISPSTITTFGFFFGLAGYLLLHLYPSLGSLSLIPALFCGWLGYSIMSAMTSAITSRMHVSTTFDERDLIGSTAEVTVPISTGRLGEITYVANAVRTTAPAKSVDGAVSFKASAKVIIIDIKDGIIYVEKCPEELIGI
jgi:hypothetical protein